MIYETGIQKNNGLFDDLTDRLKMDRLESDRKAMEVLLSGKENAQKHSLLDTYEKTDNRLEIYNNYTAMGCLKKSEATVSKEDIWQVLNMSGLSGFTGDQLIVRGSVCKTSDIPKMESSRMEKIKTENNEITLQKGQYYEYKASDGTSWGLMVNDYNKLIMAPSETIYAMEHGIKDYCMEAQKYTAFFSGLAASSSTMGLYHALSENEVQEILSDLGIDEGFFTLNIGDVSHSYYYSGDGRVYAKYEYDGMYAGFTQADMRDEYDTGDEWQVNGKTYVVDKNGHLNVPYGEDIFHFSKRPLNKTYKIINGII